MSLGAGAVRVGAAALVSALAVVHVGAVPAHAAPRAPACPSPWAPSPTTPRVPMQTNALYGVAVSGPYDAWAVGAWGYHASPGVEAEFLIEHWDGREWERVAAPSSPAVRSVLRDVDATSSTDAWTVGYRHFENPHRVSPAALHFDGQAWTQVDVGAAGAVGAFEAVDAFGSDEVWAVGYGDGGTALAARWDGAGWQRVAVEAPVGAWLQDVVVVSSDDAWAVGSHNGGGWGSQQLIMHWDGTRWTQAALGFRVGSLMGVAAVSSDDVWAVGHNAAGKATALHWDGATWTEVPVPTTAEFPSSRLFGVAASATGEVWAVGSQDGGSGGEATLVQRWDGSSWTADPSPSTGAMRETLEAVAIGVGGERWAVGATDFDSVALRRCDGAPVPTTLRANPVVRSVSATLTTTDGTGVAGVELVFDLGNGVVCTAISDSNGTGSCPVLSVPAAVRNTGYAVAFDGDQFYGPSSVRAGLLR